MTIAPETPVAPAEEPTPAASVAPKRKRNVVGIVLGSVVLAAGLFGGGMATGAAISGGSASQGQFGGGQGGFTGQPPTGVTGGTTTDGTGTTTGGTGTTTGGTTTDGTTNG